MHLALSVKHLCISVEFAYSAGTEHRIYVCFEEAHLYGEV